MLSSDKIDGDREIIFEMFRHRCIRCFAYAVTIHEIHFRSEGKRAYLLENRVPLCDDCHQWAHAGQKRERQVELTKLREEALTKYGTH